MQHGCSLLVAQLFGLAFGLPDMCHACASGSHTLHRSSDWRLAIFRRNAEYKHRVGNRLLQHAAAGFHRLHSLAEGLKSSCPKRGRDMCS